MHKEIAPGTALRVKDGTSRVDAAETIILKNRSGRMALDAAISLAGVIGGVLWIESARWPSFSTGIHAMVLGGTVFSGLFLVMGVIALRMSPRFRIIFDAAGLRIEDPLGATTVLYSNVAEAKLVLYRSVGIALKDRDAWLATFEGTPGGRDRIERLSDAHRKRERVHVVIHAKYLERGAEGILSLLSERVKTLSSSDAGENHAPERDGGGT